MKTFALTALMFSVLLGSEKSWARPEYAAAMNIVNCGVCHVNPYGGGPRTIYGKMFASRDYTANWLSKTDIASVDVRGQDYMYQTSTPPQNSQNKGVMIMNVMPTVNLPLTPDLDVPTDDHVVLSYNFAPVGQQLREAYYNHRYTPVGETGLLGNVLYGNFLAPFGLMTDEHRTYTRQMIGMTNLDFESGVMASGDPTYRTHYDVAITSGFANGGTGSDNSTSPDSWAIFTNIRHQIGNLPLQVGASYVIEDNSASSYPLEAGDLYGVFAWDRYLPKFKGNLQVEVVSARGWDNSNYKTTTGNGIAYFIPTTAASWQSSVTNANAVGLTSTFNYDMTRHWTWQVKYEQFIPDTAYQGDAFYRTGFGFKYFLMSNMDLLARYDSGYVNRPGLSTTDLTTIQAIGDTYFALLHIWL